MSRVRRSLSLMMICEELAALFDRQIRVVVQDFAEGADRGERRAQLVGHRRDEVVLQPVELLEPLVGGAELVGRGFELRDFCSSWRL